MLFLTISQNTALTQICEVIDFTSYHTVEKNTLTEQNCILIQINQRAGEKYSEFEIPYNQKNKIKVLDVQLEDIHGNTIRKLKKSEISDVSDISSGSFYEDNYTLKFNMKHNVYPYRIRVSYKVEYSEFLSITNWYPVKDHEIPTRNAKLVINVPEDYSIKYRYKNISEPEITNENGMKTYSWKTTYNKTIKKEIHSPPLHDLLPEVNVIPEFFYYGIPGSFSDWSDFGQWSYNLNRGLDELPFYEKGIIYTILTHLRSDLEKTKALYYYLQNNTRYINVSIDLGGFKPYPAEYVSQNKYGDCKALSNYMKSLLKLAGIESYYTLIHADQQISPFDKEFPSQVFNHVIVNVPLEKDTIWLECTSQTLPFGYVSTYIQNRYALLIDSNASQLVKTPELKIKDVLTERNIDVHLNSSGKATSKFSIKARGRFFEELLDFNTYASEHYQNTYIKKLFNYSNFELNDWKIESPDRDSNCIFLEAGLTVDNYAKLYSKDIVANIISTNIPDFETPSKRTLPVQIDYPLALQDEITYHYPEDWTLQYFPESKSVISRYGEYEIDFTINEDSIQIKRYFKLNPGHYVLNEYQQFFSFIESILKFEKEHTFVFNK